MSEIREEKQKTVRFRNVYLNLGTILLSDVSEDKGALFGNFDNSYEFKLYFRRLKENDWS